MTGIVEAPVGAKHGSKIGRTSLASGTAPNKYHDVGGERKIVPGFTVIVCGENGFPLKRGDGARIQLASRMATGTNCFQANGREVIEGCFAKK